MVLNHAFLQIIWSIKCILQILILSIKWCFHLLHKFQVCCQPQMNYCPTKVWCPNAYRDGICHSQKILGWFNWGDQCLSWNINQNVSKFGCQTKPQHFLTFLAFSSKLIFALKPCDWVTWRRKKMIYKGGHRYLRGRLL